MHRRCVIKKILLVDVDSKIPNIALMKLYSYYSNCDITFKKLHLDGYKSNRKICIENDNFDYTYASSIFTVNSNKFHFTNETNLMLGGTGCNFNKLPLEIENYTEDYSPYPEHNYSVGFITRGCPNNCEFCFVPKKEGNIYFYRHPKDIIRHKSVEFLDNNFLAYDKHIDILNYLVNNKIRCCFKQGLDFRRINNLNAMKLSELNYNGEYTFAFDDISYKESIIKKLEILNKFIRKEWKLKFFILVGFNSSIKDDLNRVSFLLKRKILPYIMRHENCYNSVYKDFYTDLSSFCNQVFVIKKMNFETFLNLRHKNKERIKTSLRIYNENNGNI